MAPVAATELPTFADRDCWDNFTQIFFDLVQKVPFSENTYTICPNRVYRVGYAFDGNQCCRDGDFPLAPRANTHFKCGEDGALSNNCTVVGGSFHVLFNEFVYAEELSGVTVQGFTFQSPELHTIQAAATGSLTFIDCVIKVQCCGFAPIQSRFLVRCTLTPAIRLGWASTGPNESRPYLHVLR
jgi:hypothetical protein